MLTHPLQSDSLARSMIEDRRRVPSADGAASHRRWRRRAGTVVLGAAATLHRFGRALHGAEPRPAVVGCPPGG